MDHGNLTSTAYGHHIVGLTLFSYKCSLKVLGNVD